MAPDGTGQVLARYRKCRAGAPFGYAVCRMPGFIRCIAGGLELWFERPGFPPSRRTAQAATPVANAVLSGAAPNIMPVVGGKRGLSKAVFLVEGAH
jgi:hypothetical protein